MHLLVPCLVFLGLFLLFPKGFKYLVGTWVGFTGGAFFWALFAIAIHALITPGAFLGFSLAGIVAGWVFAAKG